MRHALRLLKLLLIAVPVAVFWIDIAERGLDAALDKPVTLRLDD